VNCAITKKTKSFQAKHLRMLHRFNTLMEVRQFVFRLLISDKQVKK